MAEEPEKRPLWIEALDPEDLRFLRRFLITSGSLKALAAEYEVSYPTIRARLDRLIAKAVAAEEWETADPFERKIGLLLAARQIAPPIAEELLRAHREAFKRPDEK